MRFNLTIQNVYRGLLLGTGPLVDPGFNGRLWFPLHNLTNQEYELNADEIIIYAEFTKISRSARWYPTDRPEAWVRREGSYVEFDPEKLHYRRDVDDYLYHATGGKLVTSSVQALVEGVVRTREAATVSAEAAKSAEGSAAKISEMVRVRLNVVAAIAVVTVVVASLGAAVATYLAVAQLVGSVFTYAADTKNEVTRLTGRFESQLAKTDPAIAGVQNSIADTNSNIHQAEQQMNDLSNALENLAGKVESRGIDELKTEIADIQARLNKLTQNTNKPAARVPR